MKTQNVLVDVGNKKGSDIFFVQGEKGRELTFKVFNSMLEDFVNLAGYSATIHILKSDGNFTIENMIVNEVNSECYYTLTENDCACGGRGFYDVSLSKNNELIYTFHGDFIGDFRAVNDDSVNSVSVAYGVTFPEGFQEKLTAGEGISIIDNIISSEGVTYTAGDNINISDNNVISATDTKYTAGDNINISDNNVISATDTKYTAGDGININNGIISTDDNNINLWSGSVDISQSGSLILNESFQNFDALVFTYKSSVSPVSGLPIYYTKIVDKKCMLNNQLFTISDMFVYSNAGMFTYGKFTDNVTLEYNRWIGQGLTDVILTNINGINY